MCVVFFYWIGWKWQTAWHNISWRLRFYRSIATFYVNVLPIIVSYNAEEEEKKWHISTERYLLGQLNSIWNVNGAASHDRVWQIVCDSIDVLHLFSSEWTLKQYFYCVELFSPQCFHRIEEIANWSVKLQQIVIHFRYSTKDSELRLFVRVCVCVSQILMNNWWVAIKYSVAEGNSVRFTNTTLKELVDG